MSMSAKLLGSVAIMVCAQVAAGACHAQTIDAEVPAEVPKASAPAQGPQTDRGTSEDIVVTAQKRAENVQDVPLSIVAFGAAQLTRSGVTDVLALQRITPNFTSTRQGQIANVRLNIRGVGASSGNAIEPSVASFIDDIYVPRPGAAISRFYDVDTVEVLRGPQGTLFGRNASVGAISVHNRNPSDVYEGNFSLDGSSYRTLEAQAAVNVPVSDAVAVRVAALASTSDGQFRNLVNRDRIGGINTQAIRGTLRVAPTDRLTWILRGDYLHNDGDGTANYVFKSDTVNAAQRATLLSRLTIANGNVAPAVLPNFDNPFDGTNSSFITNTLEDRQWGITSDLSYDVGAFTTRLINSYRSWRNITTDGDVFFLPILFNSRDSTFGSDGQSHEFQLISPPDLLNDRLSFVAGLYYFRERYDLTESIDYTPALCRLIGLSSAPLGAGCAATPLVGATVGSFDQTTTSYAGYGQATAKITPAWDVTLGGRFTRDEKTGLFVQRSANAAGRISRAPETVNLAKDDDKLTWRIGTSYRPTPDVLLFASYSTGFKSGGFNSSGGAEALGQRRIFDPETVKNYELGAKTEFLDRAVLLNLTAFRMDIDNFQDRSFDGTSFTVRNAGSLRQQGIEAEATLRPVAGLRLNGAVAYLDSEFLSYANASPLPGQRTTTGAAAITQDLTGTRNNFSPKWQGAAGVQYDTALGSGFRATARGDVTFTSAANIGGVTDNNPQSIQQGYQLFGARLTLHLPGDRLSLSAYGNNLFDKGYCTYIVSQTSDTILGVRGAGVTPQRCIVGNRRSIGLRLEGRF